MKESSPKKEKDPDNKLMVLLIVAALIAAYLLPLPLK